MFKRCHRCGYRASLTPAPIENGALWCRDCHQAYQREIEANEIIRKIAHGLRWADYTARKSALTHILRYPPSKSAVISIINDGRNGRRQARNKASKECCGLVKNFGLMLLICHQGYGSLKLAPSNAHDRTVTVICEDQIVGHIPEACLAREFRAHFLGEVTAKKHYSTRGFNERTTEAIASRRLSLQMLEHLPEPQVT